MTADIWALLLPASLLAATHALSPDHWFPFVVIGRANRWSTTAVLGLALLAATGHVTTSIAVGLISVFAEKGAPASVAAFLHEITPSLLIAFGLGYALFSVYKLRVSRHGHSHGIAAMNKWLGIDPHDYEIDEHGHDHQHSNHCGHEHGRCDKEEIRGDHLSSKAAWGLVAILGFTPCVALLPIAFSAARLGTTALIAVNGVFAITAVVSILLATRLALKGLNLFKLSFFDKYGGIMAGVIILLLGISGHLIEHGHHQDHDHNHHDHASHSHAHHAHE